MRLPCHAKMTSLRCSRDVAAPGRPRVPGIPIEPAGAAFVVRLTAVIEVEVAALEKRLAQSAVVSRGWWKLGGAGTEGHGGMVQAARSRSVGKRSMVGQPSTRRMVI